MRPTRVIQAAAGPSAWIVLPYTNPNFQVGYRCAVQASASLTYKIQHGWCDPSRDTFPNSEQPNARVTRSTTTATLTMPTAMSPAIGDSVAVRNGSSTDPIWGVYDVAGVTSSTVVTYTVTNSGATAAVVPLMQYIHVADDPVNTGLTGSTEGNIAFPCYAIRINVTTYSSLAVELIVFSGHNY